MTSVALRYALLNGPINYSFYRLGHVFKAKSVDELDQAYFLSQLAEHLVRKT